MSEPLVTVAALLLAGYILMALEIFVIPGFGVAGLAALACLAAGCWAAYAHFGLMNGISAVLLVLLSVTVLLWWLPRSPFGKNVVHQSSLAQAVSGETPVAPGDTGVAESDLRPAGIARFGDVRESVVTDGEYLTNGTPLRVVRVEGTRVLVEPIDTPDKTGSGKSPRGGE